MKLAPLDNGPASAGAIGWIVAILVVVLLCTVIALSVVLIQYLLVKTRVLQGEANSPGRAEGETAPAAKSSSVPFSPDYRSAAAVPAENPHSGPTATLNNSPRTRTRV